LKSTVNLSSSTCLRDHFLLAMPGIDSGIFSGSIAYICEHGEAGAMGIVLNQRLDLNLHEIFEHLEITTARSFKDEPVLAGGPVQVDHGFVLHPPGEEDWDATLRVTEDTHLTTSQDVLKAIATGAGPKAFVIALGYAGWSAGQLEEEIAGNSWLTLPANPQVLFDTPVERRVSAAASVLGIDMNLLSSEAGHA